MANFTITVTNAGLSLLTNAVAGSTLTFTDIAMGSGTYSGSLSAATALVAPKHTLPISALIKGTGQVTVKSVLTYNTIAAGFTWTEIGLYAKDPDGGADILYAYGYAGDKGDYIPSKDEATLTEKVIRVTVMIGNAANVTAQIDGSTVYASAKDLEALEQSVNASITNITQVIQQVTGVDPSQGGEVSVDGSMVVTLTHAKTGTVHAFTGLGERTGLVPCQFKSTAGYTEGDTATIDGTAYTITLTGADDPETDLFVSGKSILVDVDTESKTINFKAGGGLSNSKLALATATADKVLSGYTFYSGDNELKTGTLILNTENYVLVEIGSIGANKTYTYNLPILENSLFCATGFTSSKPWYCLYKIVNGSISLIQTQGVATSSLTASSDSFVFTVNSASNAGLGSLRYFYTL